jgi:precorrin-6B methylase 2
MSQCQCKEIESVFDETLAEDELDKARRRGPRRTTRILIDALRARGVNGKTLLDIGGGVGTIQHQLLALGVKEAVDVDASSAYLKIARKEARRLGFEERVTFHHGNFVELARSVPRADIVTLDRVICCFDDMEDLVEASAKKAKTVYGVVYPLDAWWTRLGVRCINFMRRLRKDDFRIFAHPTSRVESILGAHGLTRTFHRRWGMWQVAVFAKERA